MLASPEVAEALVTFFARNASGDTATFHEVVSSEEGAPAIGSSTREWFAGQAAVEHPEWWETDA